MNAVKPRHIALRVCRPEFWAALALGFGLVPAALALDPGKPLKDYNCQAWTHQNGLPVNAVNALAQSSDGYIWLGTHKGLVQFDGTAFEVLGPGPWEDLRDVQVVSLCRSREGGVWFAVNRSAFAYYSPESGWQRGETAEGSMWEVTCLAETPDGVLWAGGENLKRRPAVRGRTEAFAIPDIRGILSLHADRLGRVWMGTVGQGLYCLEQGKLRHVDEESLKGRIILTMASDDAGNLWVGTHVGAICLDRQMKPQALPLPQNEVRAIQIDREGSVWLGTTGGGLLRWAKGRLEQLTKADGLCDDRVLSLLEDQEGSLWVGTRNGLNQLTDVKFPLIGENHGISAKPVISISPARDGTLWLATGEGIVNYDGSGRLYGASLEPPAPYTNYTKRVFEARDGDLYAVSGARTVRILSGGKVVASLATPDMPVALAEDSQGMIVSVAGALYRASRAGLAPFAFAGGKAPEFWWILNLWVGQDDALWVASVNGVACIRNGAFQQWTQKEGLADNNVRWVTQDRDGTVWIGTATALARLVHGQITNYRRRDGLPDENLFAIVDDEWGNLWVDAASGLFRVGKRSLEALAKGNASRLQVVRYDGPEAVKPTDRFEQESSGCRTADGRIWFPRASGALEVDPARVPVNRLAPLVRIQSARADDTDLERQGRHVVPPGRGSLTFRFAALTYIAQNQVRYKYRLEGYDPGWIDPGNRRQATYANLKPGPYSFHVIACNADGIWNQTGDSFDVVLLPHFYQERWFLALCGLAAAGSVGGLYGWRVRRAANREQEARATRAWLETQVRERTAELEARRAELEKEIEERKRMQEEVARAHQELVRASRQAGMAEVATAVLHNVGNVLNSVNVSACLISERTKDSSLDRLSRLRDLLQQHQADLAAFLTSDPQGRLIPAYLSKLVSRQASERAALINETQTLLKNVQHIKEIVAMQQNYAKAGGLVESLPIPRLVEDALGMCQDAIRHQGVVVERKFAPAPPVRVDKHKTVQILVNLFRNAVQAVREGRPEHKRVAIEIRAADPGFVQVSVRDNGVGIAPENLTRIFAHGFTTKRDGHGFGLHSGALAAKEMGGNLTAASDGPGQGATFTLVLPAAPVAAQPAANSTTPAES